ncbi:glycosyltransferase [Paradesertivirga mongoliensis]|uniref:Glycosyltransferase n=1 Tax=Paradesertivirga mongoliensis TaxID=2100740 RepID=A0ABW4ZJN3_9SPHI|nr:glycosyltransferase [Pedobacter mongoliensis]
MSKIEYKVCVVTVTYGDRWKFLSQVLSQVQDLSHVTSVVIVNNASDYDVGNCISKISNEKYTLLNQETNLGSAGGYKKGIEYASRLDVDFIWLLDDDNLPAENCLEELLVKWQSIPGDSNKKALFCLREDRTQHIKIAQGEDPYRFYLVPNNFLGFSLSRLISNQIKKTRDRSKSGLALEDSKIPFAPYGGLLFHLSVIKEIGFPNETFYLYVDDTEFTYRITEKGGEIWLIPSCRIIDIDKSQGVGYKNRLLRSALLDNWNFRTYYHVRNMIYFNKKAIKNNYLFKVNKNIYLTGLYIISICSSKRKVFNALLEAVNDGLAGKLGKKEF